MHWLVWFNRVHWAIWLNCLVAAAATAAQADDDKIAYGEYLSGTCVTCHQKSGEDKGIPAIVGWDSASFIAVMNSYKRQERTNKVMVNIANALSEDEVEALAAYFATLKPASD